MSSFCTSCGAPKVDDAPCSACDTAGVDVRLGSTIGGRYRIDSLLGEGGMGRVYRATHLVLGEPVVIKVLLAAWAQKPDARARFRREATVLAKLRHPGIVAIHDFGEHEGSLYLVMELINGHTLAEQIDKPEPLSLTRVGLIFDQILQVLEAAHAVGIVHRDLKPDNVMLLFAGDRTEHVKVLDFGLALVDEGMDTRLTSTGMVQGTLSYMSPEQCRGADVGAPTDIYALGVMLFEVFAGVTPFAATNPGDMISRQLYKEPPPIADRGRKLEPPPGIEALVRHALAKDQAQRPTASQMRDLLAAVVQGVDPTSVASRVAAERVAVGARSRDERALPRVSAPYARTERSVPPQAQVIATGPRVAIWNVDAARADALADVLAVNGLIATTWHGTSAPPESIDGHDIRAILVGSGPEVTALLGSIRAASKVPVLVLDVASASELASLIRAGASDVVLKSVADGVLCRQLWRLVRRGR